MPSSPVIGFNLTEIKLFLSGLRDNAPVGPRWKKLATRKLAEVEQNIARSLKLKALLQGLLRCRCASLQVCVERLSLSPNLRRFEEQARPSLVLAPRIRPLFQCIASKQKRQAVALHGRGEVTGG